MSNSEPLLDFCVEVTEWVEKAYAYLEKYNSKDAENYAPQILNDIDNFIAFLHYAIPKFQNEQEQNKMAQALADLEKLRQEINSHVNIPLAEIKISHRAE